jgi:hypothetical protein
VGTRGFIDLTAQGTSVTVYNHFDSYPSELGTNVLSWARYATATPERTQQTADAITAMRAVEDGADQPTEADIARLAPYTNTGVGSHDDTGPTWYQLLRDTQGRPSFILAAGVYEDAADFPADSLFAEYGYVVDLDQGVFEAYIGFQKEAHAKGRYAQREWNRGEYAPVALAVSYPLNALPTDDEFLSAMRAAEGIKEEDL